MSKIWSRLSAAYFKSSFTGKLLMNESTYFTSKASYFSKYPTKLLSKNALSKSLVEEPIYYL